MKSIVIFDDKCNACTAFGTWGKNVSSLGYSSKKAKQLMQAQFGKDYGFALMLFTKNEVYWGAHAASEVTKVAYSSSIGTIFRAVIHGIYPLVIETLNIVLRRQTLPRAPTFNHKKLKKSGSMTMTKKAKEEFNKLIQS